MLPFTLLFVIVLAVGGLVSAIVYVDYRQEKKRTEKLQAVASGMGLGFTPQTHAETLGAFTGFQLFSHGRAKKITNLIEGEANDTQVQIFDFRYTTGGGNNSHTWKQTVITFRSSKLNLPSFSLRPETIFHKIGAMFGYQDIDFDTHPDFSRQYLLRGASEEAIRGLFHEGVLCFFDEHPGLCTEGNHDRLIFYRASKRVEPENIRTFMEEGFKVAGLFMK